MAFREVVIVVMSSGPLFSFVSSCASPKKRPLISQHIKNPLDAPLDESTVKILLSKSRLCPSGASPRPELPSESIFPCNFPISITLNNRSRDTEAPGRGRNYSTSARGLSPPVRTADRKKCFIHSNFYCLASTGEPRRRNENI
jgi:hypothetical protein